jgi:intracellular sulfur oxidation DsrE/DsrF family protein
MKREKTVARRSFLARLSAAFGLGSAVVLGGTEVQAQSNSERWQGARHAEDAWYDQIPGVHRFVFDTISPEGLNQSMGFASTYLETNKTGYGLNDSDSAVIVIVRNRSTRFGYNDAMWAKYGKQFSEQLNNFVDPKTKEVPTVNIHATKGGALDRLIQRGVRVAVCAAATHGVSNSLAKATGGDADAIFKELSENLIANARLVPSGILALNRAQEHGYAVYAGG